MRRMARNLNERIKWAFERSNLTLDDVAAAFDPPISPQAVHAWIKEKKPTNPKQERLEILAKVLGVHYHWLATGSGDPATIPSQNGVRDYEYAAKAAIPLIRLSDVSVGSLNVAINKALIHNQFRPSFWDDDKERFCVEITDSSNEPAFKEGSFMYFLRHKRPQPGDFVAVDIGKLNATMIREFRYSRDGKIALEPINQKWATYEIEPERLGRDVHILGVKCAHVSLD